MLQVVHDGILPENSQRTHKINWGAAELGGAVWNVAWYLHPFGRFTRTAGHYGPDAKAYLDRLPSAGNFITGAVRTQQSTDRLLIFKQGRLPSLFLLETLQEPDIAALCANLPQARTLVFAGSRHPELRVQYRKTLAMSSPELTVFSPSYSVYDYTVDELEDFLASADLTFVNEHEAEFVCAALGEPEPGAVMARSRRGGVVTRGDAGATLYPRDAPAVALPSTSGVFGDVVGAGEAFMCGFLEGFLQTGDFPAAGRLGIAVSAQTARDGRICTPIDPARAKAEAALS
jgi:sugar/nucleoside kinase (ribokinase family)